MKPLVKEKMPRKSAGRKQQQEVNAGSKLDTNAFSSLGVADIASDNADDDEEDDDDDDRPSLADVDLLASLPPVAPVELEQDEEEKEGEFFFAIQTFITSLHELRDTVQEAWFNYKKGRIDSIRASILANTAIDLV